MMMPSLSKMPSYAVTSYGIEYEKLRYHSLHHAVQTGRLTQVRLLLKLHPALLNITTEAGLTPLMVVCLTAASPLRDRIIRTLLQSSYLDPYVQDRTGRSAAFYLIYFGSSELLKLFCCLTRFSHVSQTDQDGFSLLHYAVVREEDLSILETVATFLKGDLSPVSVGNFTPLMLACKWGRLRSAALLIRLGCTAPLIRDNSDFRSSLEHLAFSLGHKRSGQFYFSQFLEGREKTILPVISTAQSVDNVKTLILGPRSHSCLHLGSMSERGSYSNVDTNNSIYSDTKSKLSASITIQSVLAMSDTELREFIREFLVTGTRKLSLKPKRRVSMVINDRVFQFRPSMKSAKSTVTFSRTTPLSGRLSSGDIAHRWLDRVAAEMFDLQIDADY